MSHLTSKQVISRSDRAFNTTERANAEVAWREIATFMLPNLSAFMITGSQGQGGTGGIDTTVRVFDGTAIMATRDLASAIDSTLTNPATQWAELEFEDEELKSDTGTDGAVEWLQDSTKKMFKALNKSNFNTEKASAYPMLVSMGTMALFLEDVGHNDAGRFNGFQFDSVSINELAWSENRLGIVDTVYHRVQLTAKKAVERFGAKVSDRIMNDADNKPSTLHNFLHAIFPRDEEDIDSISIVVAGENRAFASVYIERSTGNFMEVSGYDEFPMFIVRFDKGPNEEIGRGSGHVALSDTRTLNTSVELLLEAAEVGMFPPLITEAENVPGGTDFSARSIITVDDIDKLMQYQVGTNLNFSQITVDRLVTAIERAFFLDKIRLPPRDEIGEMSAFETAKRVEEMQKAFGPTITRLGDEYLDPCILRSFRLMLRGGAFDPIPEIVKDSMRLGRDSLKINYVNSLARSQKFEQLTNVRQLVEVAQALAVATGSPEPLDRIDTDEVMKLNEEVLGVPRKIIRSDKDIKQIRDARNEANQKAQETDQLIKGADAASKLQ